MPLAAASLLLALNLAAPEPKVRITDLLPGKGDAVRAGDFVEVNYVGKLTSGKEFDRSRGVPFKTQVGVGRVIEGWDQGMVGMKLGGKRRLQIPAALGYGAQAMGDDIPANSDLDFEVELVRIHRAKVETVKPGNGKPLAPGDVPTFHYVLTLADGRKVDASRDRNVPATARLNGLIPGFVQGLLGMRVGEVRRVTVPPILGYGEEGIPPADQTNEKGERVRAKGSMIPGGATLVFEIELMSFVGKPAGKPSR